MYRNNTLYSLVARVLLIAWACCFQALSAHGQKADSRFFHIEHELLSNKLVRCIIKDSRGFMWFGTAEGLCRFDGTNVKVYEHVPADTTSLNHNVINAIIEDSEHNLWVGTAQGINRYDRENDNFINVDAIRRNKNHLSHGYITSLAQDNTGKIWIGTMGGGINRYDPKKFEFSYLHSGNNKDNYIASDYVLDLLSDGGKIWAGTRGGLKRFDAQSGWADHLSNVDKHVLQQEVTCLEKGNGRNLWFGTANGEVNKLSFDKGHYVLEAYAHPTRADNGRTYIESIAGDASGNLWIAAQNSGISYLDVTQNTVTQFFPEEGNAYSIGSSSISTIYIDNHGIVWMGIFDNGVYFFDNRSKKFELYQRNYASEKTLAAYNIRAFAEDADRNLWIATDSGLNTLRIRDRALLNTGSTIPALPKKAIITMVTDSDKNLWVGMWKGGVARIDPKTGKATRFNAEASGFGNNNMSCLYEDKRKTLWAGTAGSGLFYFDRKLNRFVQLSEKGKADYIPGTAYVTSIAEDADSTLWVGTLYGLFALRRVTDHTFTYTSYFQDNRPGSISSSAIEVIHEDAKGNLWFGTVDRGLNLLDKETGTFRVFGKQDGLSSNTIRGILSDSQGNLWISSNAGISKFNPETLIVKNYFKEDGLNSNHFHPESCLKTSTGEFVFGGSNGFNMFYPDSIKDNPARPIMCLTDLRINNQPVKIGGEDSPLQKHIGLTSSIALSYDQRSFILDFVAINYGPASRNNYCYKLEGFEKSWNCTGSAHRATYTNIDPGHYVFLAKGSNRDGLWADVPVRLDITIYPPFWKTWWAILTYIFIVASIFYFLFKIKTERIEIKNQLNLEKIAREKEHELTQSKMQFFTNISHELRTPLSLVMAPLERLISTADVPEKMKAQLSITYRNARRMLRLVNELMDFRKLDEAKITLQVEPVEIVGFVSAIAANFTEISNRRNIHFTIDSRACSCTGWIDRDKVETILSNFLTNAFKFVDDNGRIRIIVSVTDASRSESNGMPGGEHDRFLELTVIDNGIGISGEELPFIFEKFYQAKSSAIKKSAGTGIGLALAKGLAELHHGTITAESIPHDKTRFTLRVPIDRHAYHREEWAETPDKIFGTEPETGYAWINGAAQEDEPMPEMPQVLLVEDNDELRDYLANELSKICTVIQAVDGLDGVAMARSKTPDLIVSDIVMPRRTGLDLCADIKGDLQTSHIPIILLTAKTTTEDQLEGIGTGADVYLAKPFNVRVLKAHIKQLIEQRRKLYAMFSQDVYMMPAKITQNELDQAFLQQAIDYIVQNITNPQLNVEMLADIFNISRSQVYRKLKALTGKTAVEFIRTVRLKQALKLMDTQKYTLAEIAYKTGFTSPSYFTRSFKEQYGKAPSEYLGTKA